MKPGTQSIHDAARLAGYFQQVALAHLDRPNPAQFETALDHLLAALLAIGQDAPGEQ